MALLLAPTTAQAAGFTITIQNLSGAPWSPGLVTLTPLIQIGGVPQPGSDEYYTYNFLNEPCSTDYEDAAALAANWGFVLGTDAWLVPALADGETATISFDALPGQRLSYIAAVETNFDDFVALHTPGASSDLGVDLFDGTGNPLTQVVFDISGYDVNSTDPTEGDPPGDPQTCSNDCPADPNNCFVAPGSYSVGHGMPAQPLQPTIEIGWERVYSSFTTDGIAMADVHPTGGRELVVLSEGTDWYSQEPASGTGIAVVLRRNGTQLSQYTPPAGRDIMGIPLIENLDGGSQSEYFVNEFLSAGDGGSSYALPGDATSSTDSLWIHSPRGFPGVWNMGPSSGPVLPGGATGIVVPSYDGIIQVLDLSGLPVATYDTFANHGEVIYGHVSIADVTGNGQSELIAFGGTNGRVMVLDPSTDPMTLVYASAPFGSDRAFGSGPAVGNIDNDAALEIVVNYFGPSGPAVRAFDIVNHASSGGCEHEWTNNTAAEYRWNSPVIGDVDGDGTNEVIAFSNDSWLSVMGAVAPVSGVCSEGNVEYTHQVGNGGSAWFTPALGDLDGNDALDIVVASYRTLEVVNVQDDRVGFRITQADATFYPSAVVEKGSTNATRPKARIYVSGWVNGKVYRFNTPDNAKRPTTNWWTFMGNNQRTGQPD